MAAIYFSDSDVVMYHYYPSLVAAIIFLGLFSLSALFHGYQLVRTRTWFMIPFVLGALCEVMGYTGRLISRIEAPGCTLGPYIIQACLVLVAPALFAASVYMVLGYIIDVLEGQQLSPIRRKFLTIIFVCGDLLSLTVQSNGQYFLTSSWL